MHRPGADPENMTAEDFICDFCGLTWEPERPMVEGHRGSLICGLCLTSAVRVVLLRKEGVAPPDPASCSLCLMHKPGEPHWRSDATGAWICTWCLEKSVVMLAKDPESGWKPPTA